MVQKYAKIGFWLACAFSGAALIATGLPAAYAQAAVGDQPNSSDSKVSEILRENPLVPLADQNYGLCAGAVTFNFNGITYARCRLMHGNSLAIKHTYAGKNAQTVNQIGNAPGNGAFMVSTYSPPKPSQYALYSCPGPGSFAQCNGGICFTNTTGKAFPGLGKLSSNEIICSCPITTTRDYHVTGPAQCPTARSQYDAICGRFSQASGTANGASLYIGSGGPPEVTLAMNAYYDRVFKTSSGSKTCQRPGTTR